LNPGIIPDAGRRAINVYEKKNPAQRILTAVVVSVIITDRHSNRKKTIAYSMAGIPLK
jgi:hypothetical protein